MTPSAEIREIVLRLGRFSQRLDEAEREIADLRWRLDERDRLNAQDVVAGFETLLTEA
jgi:hypothetical protein